MGKIFKPAKPAPLPPPPVIPTRENSPKEVSAASEEDKQARQKQLGRAATLLSGRQGLLGDEDINGTATKKLLGG